jgi:hypothetical protein
MPSIIVSRIIRQITSKLLHIPMCTQHQDIPGGHAAGECDLWAKGVVYTKR